MYILICIVFSWVLWQVSSRSRRRWVVQLFAVVVIGLFLFASGGLTHLLSLGLTMGVPEDSGDRVDAIVVLGRGPNARPNRLAAAWSLWQEDRASEIFISGMLDAKAMAKELKNYGVPITSIAGEECSQTTAENALYSSTLLRKRGIKTIVLVTDSMHMWRSRSAFKSMGFEVLPHTVPLTSERPGQLKHLMMLLREYAGMIDYKLTGKLRPRSPQELDNPPEEVETKINKWRCVRKVRRALTK